MRTTAAALAAAALLAAGTAPAIAATTPLPQVEGVPVLAQSRIGNVSDDRVAVLSIHGVRRVEGGTVLYYSMGLPAEDRTGGAAYFSAYGNGNFTTLARGGSSSLVCAGAAIDIATGTAYTALRAGSGCLSTPVVDFGAPQDGLAQARVGYTVLAPVPDDVTTVDVMVGTQLLQDVPVEDGLLEPAVEEKSPVVGTGWPTVDTAAISSVPDPDSSVYPLRSRVKDIKKKVTTAQGKGGKELELDASVLFAVDKATLTSKASSVIASAAKQIAAAGTKGTIVVTGHTDSNASDSYNLALSKRRAAAVAKALKPKLPSGISIKSAGKGESQPIADNATAEGRALNRRVTITLPK